LQPAFHKTTIFPLENGHNYQISIVGDLISANFAEMASFLKKLEVKPTDDEYETIETTRWGNRDVYPIPHDKRTYGVYAFVAYWGESLHGLLISERSLLKSNKQIRDEHFKPA